VLRWGISIVAVLISAFFALSLLQERSLRHASLIGGMNSLKVAYDDFTRYGYITNYPSSGFRVQLSSKTPTIDGTQYHCFAEVDGGWGYDGGTLAMTTNRVFIWLDPERTPKIITKGYIPAVFSRRY
jgi:hypothetical protein